jgi:hypothetical protein
MMSPCSSLLWSTYKSRSRYLLNPNRRILHFDASRLPKFPAPSSTLSATSGEPTSVGPMPPNTTRYPAARRHPLPGPPTLPGRPMPPDTVLMPPAPPAVRCHSRVVSTRPVSHYRSPPPPPWAPFLWCTWIHSMICCKDANRAWKTWHICQVDSLSFWHWCLLLLMIWIDQILGCTSVLMSLI